jgi:hypothetical protein
MTAEEEIGHLMAVGIAFVVLGQIRLLEEKVLDPDERWRILRRGLEQFCAEHAGSRS